VGNLITNEEWTEIGLKAAQYALIEQKQDGSLSYWGQCQDRYNSTAANDHYHIGFEIRSLYNIWKTTKKEEFKHAYKRYYYFYLENLILEFGNYILPKNTKYDLYPIDIHSCAESLLLNATLAEDELKAYANLKRLAQWTITNMQMKDGWFIYMIRQIIGYRIKIKVPYVRWGQSWMLLALTECFKLTDLKRNYRLQ
jgi:hypothetical protein